MDKSDHCTTMIHGIAKGIRPCSQVQHRRTGTRHRELNRALSHHPHLGAPVTTLSPFEIPCAVISPETLTAWSRRSCRLILHLSQGKQRQSPPRISARSMCRTVLEAEYWDQISLSCDIPIIGKISSKDGSLEGISLIIFVDYKNAYN